MVDMTTAAIQQITKEMKQYSTPSLNDKLYLHFKGWKKLEPCLGEYTGVRALWLEGNGLTKLENLENLTQLRCLYIQQNLLDSLEGLEANADLDAINVSNNSIKTISHLSHIKKLNTLQIANNRLSKASDIEHLRECPSIGVLDLQNNRLDDPVVLDVLADMPNLRVLQLQGNPVTRAIPHYRKTAIARCMHLTYLDDRPVFEDERRTNTAWVRAGAAHKIGPDGILTAAAIKEAFADGSFDKNAAHEAEKEERKKIKEEKEEQDRRNRQAFEEMLLDARVRRFCQILPNVRLLAGISEDVIRELAYKVAANPVHTNLVCGFAKDEVCISAGTVLGGLYIISKGKMKFNKNGKPAYDDLTLGTGQYFGEPSLCTSKDIVAAADVVCKEYSELYLLSKEDLMEVATIYESTLDILSQNRSKALRCQWYECRPWRSYDLVFPQRLISSTTETSTAGNQSAQGTAPEAVQPGGGVVAPPREWTEEDTFITDLAAAQSKYAGKVPTPVVDKSAFLSMPSVVTWCTASKIAPKPCPVQALPKYPLEWYSKYELARSVQLEGEEDEGADGSEVEALLKARDSTYEEQWQRVQQAKQAALREAGLTEAEFERGIAERKALARREAGLAPEEAQDLPALEDVDVSAVTASQHNPQASISSSTAVYQDTPPPSGSKQAEGQTEVKGHFRTEYERDNAGRQGLYAREMEVNGDFDHKVECAPKAVDGYIAGDKYAGSRVGFVFRMGELGLGYYADDAKQKDREGEEEHHVHVEAVASDNEEEACDQGDGAQQEAWEEGDMDALD